MSSLDECLDLVQQGTIAFAVGSAGFVYLSDQARLVQRWWSFVSERRRRSRTASAPLREEEARAGEGEGLAGEDGGAARDGVEADPGATFVVRPRRVERVVVRSGALIDAVTFFYEGVPTGETYGGQGGTEHPAFELGPSEWVAEVRGRRGAYIDSLQLVSNTGRASPVYGGAGGEQFSFKVLNAAAIGGLDVVVSVNGWLRSIRGVIEVSQVQLHPPETPIYVRENGIVHAHQRRVRKRLRFLHLSVVAYAAFLIFSMSGFVLDLARGPVEVTAEGGEPRGIVRLPAGAPVVADSLSFADGQELVRWVIVDLAGQDQQQQQQQQQAPQQQQQHAGASKPASARPVLGMLVKEVVERAATGVVPATPGSSSNSKAAERSPATGAGRTQPGTAADNAPHAAAARGPSYRRTGVVRRLDLSKDVLVFDEFVDSPLFRWLWGVPADQQQEQQPDEQAAPRAEHPAHAHAHDDDRAAGSARRKAKGRISGQGAMYPRYFVDESFSPALVYLTSGVVLAVFLYTLNTELRQSTGRGDPVIARFELGAALLDAAAEDAAAGGGPGAAPGVRPPRDPAELAREVDMEILEPGALVLPWSSSLVAVTRNWLIKTNYLGLDAVAIADARLVDLRVSGRWIMGELVEIVTLRIESRASVAQSGHHRGRAAYFFDVALPRMQFELLQQSFVERVNRGQERHVAGLEQRFLRRFRDMLRLRAAAGVCFEPLAVDEPLAAPPPPPAPEPDVGSAVAGAAAVADALPALSASLPPGAECLGACGLPPTVLIKKRCDTCEERDGCLCQAAWCHECIVKWWLTKNRTKLE